MAAPSETYIDPATGTDAGGTAGTVGDPFASLQYAYNNTTFDTTNGHIFYVKNGTEDNTSNTSLTFANRTSAAPMYVVGYGGGTGHINTGTAAVQAAPYNYIHWQDMEVTSSNSSGLNVGAYSTIMGSTINANALMSGGQSKCYGNTIGGTLTVNANYGEAKFNVVTHSSGYGITCGGNSSKAEWNLIKSQSGATGGILLTNHNSEAINNSLYANATVSIGINCDDASFVVAAINNLIDGYTTALQTASNTNGASFFCNSVYGETTLESFSADEWYFGADTANESLGASPFTNAGSDDFTPVNTGSVASAFGATSSWRGAISPSSSGGGIQIARGQFGGMRG